jgi:hypothetical protein
VELRMSEWTAKRAASEPAAQDSSFLLPPAVASTEHVMFKDPVRKKIVCAKCGLPWPCQTKVDEILAKIKRDKLEAQ